MMTENNIMIKTAKEIQSIVTKIMLNISKNVLARACRYDQLNIQISEMTDDELETKFALYSEIQSRDAFTEVMQELLDIELDNRELA